MNISRLYNFLAGTPASAAEVNAELDQLVTMFNTNTVQTDGSKAMTGLLSLANLDPTLPNHATRKIYADGLITTHLANAQHGGGGGGGPTWVRLASDYTLSSPQGTIPGLNLALAANTTYRVLADLWLYQSTAQSTGFTPYLTGPTGTTGVYNVIGTNAIPNETTAQSVIESHWRIGGLSPNVGIFASGPSTLPVLIRVESIVVVGATAGNLVFNVGSLNYTPVCKANSMASYQAIA